MQTLYIYKGKLGIKMEENKGNKISFSTVLLIIAVIIIAVMGYYIYKLNTDKNIEIKKSTDLQAQVSNLNSTVNSLQTKINTISETVNTPSTQVQETKSNVPSKESITPNSIKSDVIKYEITKKKNQTGEEVIAVIKATKDDKTVTKEFEMSSLIADTGTMVLPTIGSVALVADSGGEYYGVNIYQLVNGEIKKLGTIDCGADMVKDATYSVETKGEATAVITANRNGETIKKEFEMSAAIAKTEIIDVLECGKVVLIAETGGEYYAFKVFRLSQDYSSGKIKGIVEAGLIQYSF